MRKEFLNRDVTLIQGDCVEVMKQIEAGSIDAIITDPPYGTTACKWDTVIPFNEMWSGVKNSIKDNSAIVLFGGEPFSSLLRTSNLSAYKYDWKYKKRIASNFASAKYQPMKHIEDVMVFEKNGKKTKYNPIKQARAKSGTQRLRHGYKSNSDKGGDFIGGIDRNVTEKEYNHDLKFPEDIQEFNNRAAGDRGYHPTQKPVALMEYLIKTYTNKGDTVLDFTMGSGTTGVAAVNTGRKFIGIELDPDYFNIACKRIEEAIKGLTS